VVSCKSTSIEARELCDMGQTPPHLPEAATLPPPLLLYIPLQSYSHFVDTNVDSDNLCYLSDD
jgi:hypothetical protein